MITTVTPQPATPAPRSTALAVTGGLWAAALLPIGGVLGLATVLGLSTPSCSEPAPFLCDHGWVGMVVLGLVALGWLVALGFALSAAGGRQALHLGWSLVALLVAVGVLVVAGSLVAG